MSDNPNAGYYQSSRGSLSGFDQIDIPTGNPNLREVGWSLENLRKFLTNQNGANFPSPESLALIEQRIRDHLEDTDNPHKTSLNQIVGSIVEEVLGNITSGTIPEKPPVYSYFASLGLPLNTICPATFTSANLFRKVAGGWLIDADSESDVIGTDFTSGCPGIPLFSNMNNIVLTDWVTNASTRLNTTISITDDDTLHYPFSFYEVRETPVTALFGVDIPMTQDLQVSYTTNFHILPSVVGGSVRIYQPGDPTNYAVLNLTTGALVFEGDALTGTAYRSQDGVIRVSIGFTSLQPTADNRLRVVHLNPSITGDGTRTGSNGRFIFSIAHPQATTASINQPTMVDTSAPATTSVFGLDFAKVGIPATIDRFILTLTLDMFPKNPLASVIDPNILTFGNLLITRDQTQIRVSVGGNTLFTSDILEGFNRISLSYSPTKIIFKDLQEARQVATGTYASLPTTAVTMGPFGGYLCDVSLYAQEDRALTLEFLTNG